MLTRTAPGRPPRAAAALVLLAAGAAFGVLVRRLWPFTVDDTYTTLRYARHLAAGAGLAYNLAPPRAEGYTSLAWTLLMAVPHALRGNAVLAAKLAGVAATLATAWVVSRWAAHVARGDGSERVAAFAAPVLYLALPATAVHAVSGMETALASLMLTLVLATAGAAAAGDARAARALAPLATLLALTRPEGVMAGALAIACVAWLHAEDRSALLWRAMFGFVLPLAAYEAWRLAYYGLPLPLPFYVKLAHPGRLAGAEVIVPWLARHAWRIGVFVLLAAIRPRRSVLPALVVVAALTLFLTLPQHLMGFQHRYAAPCDPALAVLAAVGLDRLLRWGLARGVPAAAVALGGPALLALAAAGQLTDARTDVPERLEYARGMARAHLPLARALAGLKPAGTLALSDAGAIPYLTDWETLDLIGLNDPGIALTHRRDPAAILARAPEAIVLVSREAARFTPWDWNAYEAPLFAEALRAGYRRDASLEFAPDYWLWVMARPGSRVERAVAAVR